MAQHIPSQKRDLASTWWWLELDSFAGRLQAAAASKSTRGPGESEFVHVNGPTWPEKAIDHFDAPISA